MYTNADINDYVNNRASNAMHMGVEEFTQYRRHGPGDKTTDARVTAETQARVYYIQLHHHALRYLAEALCCST